MSYSRAEKYVYSSKILKRKLNCCFFFSKIIKEKDELIYKLNDIRDKLENEIRELTASLFEVIVFSAFFLFALLTSHYLASTRNGS